MKHVYTVNVGLQSLKSCFIYFAHTLFDPHYLARIRGKQSQKSQTNIAFLLDLRLLFFLSFCGLLEEEYHHDSV